MSRAVPRDFPRWGGPDANSASEQFGLAEVAQSRMVLAGALALDAAAWVDTVGLRPETSFVRGHAVQAAYFEAGYDGYLLLASEPDRTEVWAYAPPVGFGHETPPDGATGRAQLLRLLDQLGLDRSLVVFPRLSDD